MWVWGGNFDSSSVDYFPINFYMHTMAHYFVLIPHSNCRVRQLRNFYLSGKRRDLNIFSFSLRCLKGGLGPDHVTCSNSGRKPAGARRAPLKKWLLHRGVLRPRAGSRARATPSPLLPYHEAGESPKPGLDLLLGRYRGQWSSRVPHPRAREPKADCLLAAWNSKPIPKLSVHALPSAPPLPGGHAFPPLTSGVAGPACL